MKKKLTIAFISSVLLTLFIGLFINKAEAETINYIYFDLNCGSVTLNVSTYSGCVYQTIDGETTSLTVSGTHNSSNYYYVYQSNDSNKSSTGVINGSTIVPTYASLKSVTDSFINETDVEKVISTWRTEATSAGRTTTGNFIALSGALKANITIDNIWSSFHEYGTGRRNGGISFISSSGSNVTINLKGENRVGNIYYSSSSSNTNTFKITSADGSKKTTGALVVANINSGTNTNYWDSAIGGSDSGGDYSKGIVIDGGTIYAGTNKADNSTAIGGGGNGYGGVTISGGIVTAVSHTTGTAIGGGIGYSSRGGDAYVKITGGTVYAYNYGQNYT